MFKPARRQQGAKLCRSFNPSVGILGVQAGYYVACAGVTYEFQSLGRDSGCSSWCRRSGSRRWGCRFNPSVGILGVQATCRPSPPRPARCFNPSVGILGVQARDKDGQATGEIGFNPSVGILGVQAGWPVCASSRFCEFQSLGRDSGCSSRTMSKHHDRITRSFNPSVGILGVQARRRRSERRAARGFQSLGRDSGCSSSPPRYRGGRRTAVSIPRSGFWVFKHGLGEYDGGRRRVFQSLGRDSGCSSCECCVFHCNDLPCFNPSVGILGVQARQ